MELTSFADELALIIAKFWEKIPGLVLTLIVGYIIVRIVSAASYSAISVSRAKAALKDILMSIINIALWILLLAALLQQMGLTQLAFALSGFVAFAGLAITAGASSLVQDIISGVFLAQDPDFNVGDYLKVGDMEGTVEKMDARKIRLRDNKGKLHVLPNATLDKTSWVVMDKK